MTSGIGRGGASWPSRKIWSEFKFSLKYLIKLDNLKTLLEITQINPIWRKITSNYDKNKCLRQIITFTCI
jgi:hypothetical protein